MELLFGKSKARFTNAHLGSFKHGERVTGHAPLMRQLAAFGLIDLDEVCETKKSLTDGQVKQSSALPAEEALPIQTVEQPKKRKNSKKQK